MKIFIEADSIATPKMSGIGHATLEMIRQLDLKIESDSSLLVTAIVPWSKRKSLGRYMFKHIRVKALPPGQKYVNYLLTRTGIPVPMDMLYGRGIYVFPNYKTWYVLRSKAVTFVHDVVFKIHPETVNPKNLVYLNSNFERWMKRASKIISISESSLNEFKLYFPEYADKSSAVLLGVDRDVFYPRPEDQITTVRQKYELPDDYLLYVGNVEPRKNIEALLIAYEKFATEYEKKNPVPALVLVGGDGWKNETILRKIEELKTLGYSIIRPSVYVTDDDLPGLYSGCRALVHVAIHEGFGLSPVQARACGRPVVVSKIPVMTELLSGSDVVFVDHKSTESIARGIMSAMNIYSPTRSVEFTWTDTISKLMIIFAKLDKRRN